MKRRGLSLNSCLWPAPYNQDTEESAYRFLTECWWTDNEANQRIELIPRDDYIREFINAWFTDFKFRRPMLFEKSRRMCISWAARGLETWQMGLKRGSWLIVDQTHKNAGEHLWRIHFALTQLYSNRPELEIKQHRAFGSVEQKAPTSITLPNGSIITQAHQDAGGAQGKGMTGVTLEEISKYTNPEAFWGQALIVAMGTPGSPGGWVCGIANASAKPQWKAIKSEINPRELLGLD